MSLSCFPLLTCHSVGDLWKPQYGSHASDAMLPSNENDDWETMKILLKCIPYYEQSERPKRFVVWFLPSDIPCIDKSVKGNN